MNRPNSGNVRSSARELLRVENLVVEFRAPGGGKVHAVSDVSFTIGQGETLGLVGESGCGKSTTVRAILQLPPPTSGRVIYQDLELTSLRGERLRRIRPRLQIIFQDPISSLNPRRKVGDIVAEPLVIAGVKGKKERTRRVREMLDTVGLDGDTAIRRRPHEFSGGQCQRISIARALIREPELLICDEPVSALDVSIQAQILNLLEDMKARYGLTILFISHDLAVVKNISDRVGVMYLGKLCEFAPSDTIYQSPAHPYTKALMSAVPVPDPEAPRHKVDILAGDLPSPINPPSGCRFRTRCPRAEKLCQEVVPPMREVGHNHQVACHFPLEGFATPGH